MQPSAPLFCLGVQPYSNSYEGEGPDRPLLQQPPDAPVCLNMQPYSGGGDGYERGPGRAFLPQARSSAEQPKDFFLWSLFNFAFFNCCCLGFAALVYSVKSRDCKVVGDPEGAARHGKTAKSLNITALVVVSLLFINVIIATIIFFSTS